MYRYSNQTVKRMPQPILIVEDNDANMRLFTDILSSCDLPLMQAGDAETALEMLKSDPLPCLIIMDIQLPGM